MKKVFAIFVTLFISLSLWAQEEDTPGEAPRPGMLTLEDDEQEPPPKKRAAIKNRGFELSLVNIDLNLSNSFLAANDVIRSPSEMIQTGKFFRDSVSINFNDFFRGFTFFFGTMIKPLSLNINWKDKWGFGLDVARVNVTGNLQLSGDLLSFNEVENDRFGTGMAIFTDFGIPVFFHVSAFKIKIRPSVFLPLV